MKVGLVTSDKETLKGRTSKENAQKREALKKRK